MGRQVGAVLGVDDGAGRAFANLLLSKPQTPCKPVIKVFQAKLTALNPSSKPQLWDDKMAQFQESVMEQVSRLRDAHADATRLLRANFETRRPTKPQPSTKLLDQRKIQVGGVERCSPFLGGRGGRAGEHEGG